MKRYLPHVDEFRPHVDTYNAASMRRFLVYFLYLNNVDDGDGCPDQGKVLVNLTKEKIEILDKVFFKTGKDELDRKSFGLLDNVANVLNAHTEIAHIRVEGHTDDVGDDAKNKELSELRAKAVVAYLVQKDVAASRLVGVGFGEEKPVADNSTEEGKAKNRRVEFTIEAP
jgi:outer membrane protein OmpA-like peptidoglycan-associated protein